MKVFLLQIKVMLFLALSSICACKQSVYINKNLCHKIFSIVIDEFNVRTTHFELGNDSLYLMKGSVPSGNLCDQFEPIDLGRRVYSAYDKLDFEQYKKIDNILFENITELKDGRFKIHLRYTSLGVSESFNVFVDTTENKVIDREFLSVVIQ